MGLILEYGGHFGISKVPMGLFSMSEIGGMPQLELPPRHDWNSLVSVRVAGEILQIKKLLPQVNVYHITIQQPQPPFSFLPVCSGSFSGMSGTLVICIGSGDSARCGCFGLDNGLAGGLSWILGMVE